MFSSILMLFYYLAPLQNDSIVTSQCTQFTFGDKGEVYRFDESALTEKESVQEGKRSIGPRMKYGHTNLSKSISILLPHCIEGIFIWHGQIEKVLWDWSSYIAWLRKLYPVRTNGNILSIKLAPQSAFWIQPCGYNFRTKVKIHLALWIRGLDLARMESPEIENSWWLLPNYCAP